MQAESDARAALATMCAVWTAPADDAPDAYAEYAADAPLLGSSIVDLFERRRSARCGSTHGCGRTGRRRRV